MKPANFLIFGLLILFVGCTSKQKKTDKIAKEVQKEEAPVEKEITPSQLSLSIQNNNLNLTVLDHIKQYLKDTFPEKTIIETGGINFSEVELANIVFSDSAKYIVEIKTGDGTNISVHDRTGNQLGFAEIFNEKSNSVYTHYNYYIITPNDIRIHVWNYKNGEPGRFQYANIEKEEYLHFNINEQGMINKVEKPKHIIDFFSILPRGYLSMYINDEIQLFPDLKDGYYWYHTYISKEFSVIIDKKNGYIELISTMALFKANDVSYFVLTNFAGGTCETFYYHFFLTYDESINQFIPVSDEDIIPEIDKFSLYEQPDLIKEKFKTDNIQLRFIPPRHGTIMKLEPYIDDCGIEDPEIMEMISKQKPIDLKWDRDQAMFLKVLYNVEE